MRGLSRKLVPHHRYLIKKGVAVPELLLSRIETADIWKSLTTTVGLVSAAYRDSASIMAAEWTYFLNKDPLYVAVALSRRSVTRDLIRGSGGFSVTLCSESQAELADFVGSFSGRDIDKSSAEALDLRPPAVIGAQWVAGGVISFECLVRQVMTTPDYQVFVGEAVAIHPEPPRRPLVKHGPMHALGPRLELSAIVAGAGLLPPSTAGSGRTCLRVAATGRCPDPGAPWHITLVGADRGEYPLAECPSGEYGDLLAEFELPEELSAEAVLSCLVKVERSGLKAGWARVVPQPGFGPAGCVP
jgi:flavin reductase (DIM6/NTAB) family NADH-FMN oxidoreductase RutF